MEKGISALWKEEDWWAVWLGFIIIGGALLKHPILSMLS